MADPLDETEYTIAAVSKLTGVSCHALRVWERRYGLPVPHRTASGHRRYRADQVRILLRLSELNQAGRSIGELITDFQTGRLKLDVSPSIKTGNGSCEAGELTELMERLIAGDSEGADACFRRLESAMSPEQLVMRVIAPALTEAGERWYGHGLAIYQEHLIAGFLRRKLDEMIEWARRANVNPMRRIVLGAVQGDRHEGGVQITHLLLERAGWRVINLGTDLPVSEYVRAVEILRPDALALSFVLSRNINKRFQELTKVQGLPVFVGGRSILNYQMLAKRHGLIPVAGPASVAIPQMIRDFETWLQIRGRVLPPT